jgi:hypothetical protein
VLVGLISQWVGAVEVPITNFSVPVGMVAEGQTVNVSVFAVDVVYCIWDPDVQVATSVVLEAISAISLVAIAVPFVKRFVCESNVNLMVDVAGVELGFVYWIV